MEHNEDDSGFFLHLFELLKPNGMLYLTVPAFGFLWSQEDVKAGHFRRYTNRQMNLNLQRAGFDVTFATYIFRWLPIPVFLFRTLPSWLGSWGDPSVERTKKDHAVGRSGLPSILQTSLHNEIKLLKNKTSSVFGGSCLIAARKTL